MQLSTQAKSLWAKMTKGNSGDAWLPLYLHMSDAAEMAKRIWYAWLPPGSREVISCGVSLNEGLDPWSDLAMQRAFKLFVFLAAAHDVGKAIPVFQAQQPFRNPGLGEQLFNRIKATGLPLKPHKDFFAPHAVHHSLASQRILENNGLHRTCAVILGGHHGKPPSNMQLNNFPGYRDNTGFNNTSWQEVQDELLMYALKLAGLTDSHETSKMEVDIPGQALLTGLVIMVDWLVSDEYRFEYLQPNLKMKSAKQRVRDAWADLALPPYWEASDAWEMYDLFEDRFGFNPRPVQEAVIDIIRETTSPGIMVIEAPMGAGKTEAALAAAEMLAQKTGRGGVFFALPTQATADGIFNRVHNWITNLSADGEAHSLFLAHGKSRFNKEYQKVIYNSNVGGLDGELDNVLVHDWFDGRKKGILSDFVVGTVDQVLMGGLKQKHLALRHLGLANKVLIIDECHAYDAYMSQYLFKILRWLGAYHVPVLVLSATLPGDKRFKVINAYLGADSTPQQGAVPWLNVAEVKAELPAWATNYYYPIITYSDDGKVKQCKVETTTHSYDVTVAYLKDEDMIAKLEELLSSGGCAGIIMNTVKRAQMLAKQLADHFGQDVVHLLHSRFISTDRVTKELRVRDMLGPAAKERPDKVIVVGTQVMEQSLDVDFDVLLTDICPMDLLIQRIGRLHRHDRLRPDKLKTPLCFVTGVKEDGFDKGAKAVYGEYMLMNSQALLESKISLPADIPVLVQKAYAPQGVEVKPELAEKYAKAKLDQEKKIKEKEQKASVFQIFSPDLRHNSGTLIGWLDTSVTDDHTGKKAEATVRDIDSSLEVILIQKKRNGSFYLLPWLETRGGEKIPTDYTPDDEMAALISSCTVNLPRSLAASWMIEKTIDALEKSNLAELPGCWQDSSWLKGELFIVLDEGYRAEISIAQTIYTLKYDEKYGLLTESMEVVDD